MPQATIADVLPTRVQPRVRAAWWVMTVLAVAVGLYALAQQDGRPQGGSFRGWTWVDHVHFSGGGIALIVGAFLFHRGILERHLGWHHRLGKIYMVAVLASGLASLLMATNSFAGTIADWGFGTLGVLWLVSSGVGLLAIKRGAILRHRQCMVVSYACCYAAVTLRIQIPLLVLTLGSFESAFRVVAWSCWVPNLFFAWWWLARTGPDGNWLGPPDPAQASE